MQGVFGEKVDALKKEGGDLNKVDASTEIKTFVEALAAPRKIMLLVPVAYLIFRGSKSNTASIFWYDISFNILFLL